ncbi:glycosyltransferase family 2 protein [Candidatus Chloroploca sp. Khr17]|uniref:glycosyltransferase family 2 protein n=1 Tax=Candidatus Chloroploca sp. Khr17 TaxID=2496869 RepID=UPI00101DB81F|nr:glycosyltransferase family 2 protein [Candidatus Chloroploca sp. Khr17]
MQVLNSTGQAYPFTVTVVMPAYNEAHGIAAVIERVRAALPDAEILVVDDASTDATGAAAAAAGARVERHPANRGNGAAVKTGIRRATGDVVLLMDADGQMDPRYIPAILDGIADGYDMVVGARTRDTQGDSLPRRLGNRALDALGGYLVETEVRDLTSGYRAMRREIIMEYIHLLPNRYSYPTTSTLALLKGGHGVGFVTIEGKRRGGGQSGQKLMRNGIRFGLIILRIISLFAPLRVYFPVAVLMFSLGLLSWLLNVFLLEPARGLYIPNSALLLFVGSIIIFLFGLLAEQLAALRFQRHER